MAGMRKVKNYERNAFMRMDDDGGAGPSYFPNSKGGPVPDHRYEESTVMIRREEAEEEAPEGRPGLTTTVSASPTTSPEDDTRKPWDELNKSADSVASVEEKKEREKFPNAAATARRYDFKHRADDFEQAALLYGLLSTAERNRLTRNIAATLKEAREEVQERVVKIFTAVDKEYGSKIQSKMAEMKMMKSTMGSTGGVKGVSDPE